MTTDAPASDRLSVRLAHLLWLAAFAVLCAPTLLFLWDKWTRNIWYNGHGVFMPFLVAFLAYYALQREPVKREEPSVWGFLFLVPGLFLIAVDSAIHTELLSAFGLLVCLPGFSLLVLGPRRTRAIAFPLALGFLMLPIPSGFRSGIHLALREMTTSGSAWLLHQLGRPALANGTLLHMPHGSFHVVEECSGFSAVYAAITVALVLAYLSRSWGRRVLLLALAFPLALGGNVLRITGLGLLAESRGYEILETPVHVLSGYASFVLSLALLFLFAERRSRSRAA